MMTKKTFYQLICFKVCFFFFCCCIVALAGITGQAKGAESANNDKPAPNAKSPEKVMPPNRWRTADEIDENEVGEGMQALRNKDAERITIGQASHFHMLFIDRCLDKLPDEVGFRYVGPLATEGNRRGLRVHGPPASILEWNIQDGVVLFSVWISTVRTKYTLAAFPVGESEMFANVSFVSKNRSIDEKLPKLGNRSVREVLSDLTKPGKE